MEVLNLTYASSLTDLCERNSSFDAGILRIAYTGKNRNGSYISKDTFEKCLKTIYNCPIVCNYDRETDTLGGHDVEIVSDNNGIHIVNMTTPIGCIPESANVFWQTVEEEDGTEHEYLCAEALLWKRQEGYQKIKRDGYSAQSMEITVKDGERTDGVYVINDFEFTAFALIGVEPCFESASLDFSVNEFRQQLSQMMLEIKESFNKVESSSEDEVDIHPQTHLTEGGEKVLEEKIELLEKYNINIEELDFSIDDYTIQELEEKFSADNGEEADNADDNDGNENEEVTPEEEPVDEEIETEDEKQPTDNFELQSLIDQEIRRSLREVTVKDETGYEFRKYWMIDYDSDKSTVYAFDEEDGLLYGMTYAMNGDNVVIDFESKKRVKCAYVEFDEGEQANEGLEIFDFCKEVVSANAVLRAEYQKASDAIAAMETEVENLRKFKNDTEAEKRAAELDDMFAEFADLEGNEVFEALKSGCADMDIRDIEEKCYAIRGRFAAAKHTADQSKPIRLKVPAGNTDGACAPYGGLFEEYGVTE